MTPPSPSVARQNALNALPAIAKGFATKLGVGGAAALAMVAAATAILNGDHTEETVGALIGSVLVLSKVLEGRYRQATAQIHASGQVDAAILTPAPGPVVITDTSPAPAPVTGKRQGP